MECDISNWFAVAAAALVTTSVAVGAVPKKVTVTGPVQAVSPVSIKVAGTTCVFAPTNSRMMMPAIIRDIGVGDTAQLCCVRANGRLVVASIIERPAGAVVVRGAVSATDNSITIRGVTCTFSVTGSPNPRIMAPTRIDGQGLMACLRANGQLVLSAATELTPALGASDPDLRERVRGRLGRDHGQRCDVPGRDKREAVARYADLDQGSRRR